jgi:hypothetical protein
VTTCLDLITDSLQRIGSYAAGETISAADAEQCRLRLNRMIDSWSNESLMCYTILQQSVVLLAGKITYTIGPGGDINSTRPIRVITGPGAAFLKDSNDNRYPVDVVPRDKWNEIWNLTRVNSNLPDTMFYDPKFPLGEINVNPSPNGSNITLYWNSYLQLTEFAALTTTVQLPPGYELLIVDNLAVGIWRYFKDDKAQIPADLIRDAMRSMGNVKRSNTRENIAEFDKVMIAQGSAVYNVYSDSFR